MNRVKISLKHTYFKNIIYFHMNPLIIISRVLKGISTLYLLGNKTYNYNVYLLYFAFFSVLLFIIYLYP